MAKKQNENTSLTREKTRKNTKNENNNTNYQKSKSRWQSAIQETQQKSPKDTQKRSQKDENTVKTGPCKKNPPIFVTLTVIKVAEFCGNANHGKGMAQKNTKTASNKTKHL